jgi:hypothetical protein
MNRNYDRTMNDRMIERTNDRNFGSITAGQRLSGRTMNRDYERTDERSNDRTNERSEFQQHNDRKKIIWTNERTNDRTIGRTDERTMNDRTNDRTIERSDERTNKLRTGGRMIEERPNDPCASVCLCGTWSGCVCVRGGRELP